MFDMEVTCRSGNENGIEEGVSVSSASVTRRCRPDPTLASA